VDVALVFLCYHSILGIKIVHYMLAIHSPWKCSGKWSVKLISVV